MLCCICRVCRCVGVSVCQCVGRCVASKSRFDTTQEEKRERDRERESKKNQSILQQQRETKRGKNKSTSSLTAIRWIGLRLDWPALCWDYFGLDRIELDWMIIDFNGYQVDWGCFSCSDCTAIECNWVWIQLDSIALDSSFIFIDCVWVFRF